MALEPLEVPHLHARNLSHGIEMESPDYRARLG